MCRGPAGLDLARCYFVSAICSVVTAGLPACGSVVVLDAICFSVLTPTIFPNTGAVIETASLVFVIDDPLGTRPVYAHTPPHPYSMLEDEISFSPSRRLTLGGLTLPPLVKSIGP